MVELEAKARVIQEKNDLINKYKKNLDQLVVAKNEAANKEHRLLLAQTLEGAREVGFVVVTSFVFRLPFYSTFLLEPVLVHSSKKSVPVMCDANIVVIPGTHIHTRALAHTNTLCVLI